MKNYHYFIQSILKALSIQVHPSKKDVLKDPNHKPKFAIAFNPFLAVCGLRPFRKIHQLFSGMGALVIFIAFLLAHGICSFCHF
jgi:mannose-6-phosphate isomerase class I